MRNLIKKNARYSKRINYDALKDLFTDDGPVKLPMTPGPDDKDDNPLYTMDDRSDGESMLVVEETGGGGVGMAPARVRSRSTSNTPRQPVDVPIAEPDEDEDAPGEDDIEEENEKGDYNDWDAYEQEV